MLSDISKDSNDAQLSHDDGTASLQPGTNIIYSITLQLFNPLQLTMCWMNETQHIMRCFCFTKVALRSSSSSIAVIDVDRNLGKRGGVNRRP